jgi:integrase
MKEHGQEHDFIFIKSDGTPAKVSTIRSWMEKWDSHLTQHWYPHAGRHFWTSYLIGIGLEKQLVQELQSWSSDALVDIYNDNTAKDVKWKGLEKLKAHLSNEIPKEDIELTE